MSPADRTEAPIYATLIEERGDVPAEVRRTAEQAKQELERAINFNTPRPYGYS
ncbi:hypothetical protein [Streptomyces sp. NPDC059176]|uniref:hypothetical protein n=1 Tax=unclassified Streptomyces TaxID=2593676 RepID=UPI00368344C6